MAGYFVALEAAKKAEVPIAPLLPYGFSCFHMRPEEPGTLTIRDSTLYNILYDIGRSLVYHGFKKIVYVTGHTSNAATIDRVVRAIRYDTGALGISYAGDTEVFAGLCQDLIDDPDSLPGWHAGEIETSGALYFAEDYVHMDRAEKRLPTTPTWMKGDMEKKDSGSGFRFKYRDYPIGAGMDQYEYSDIGVMGDPLLASKEKGKKIYDRMTDLFADFLRDLKEVEVDVHTRDFPERV
jgi:creatinine amidohydrolase